MKIIRKFSFMSHLLSVSSPWMCCSASEVLIGCFPVAITSSCQQNGLIRLTSRVRADGKHVLYVFVVEWKSWVLMINHFVERDRTMFLLLVFVDKGLKFWVQPEEAQHLVKSFGNLPTLPFSKKKSCEMGTAYQSFQACQKVSRCKPELLATEWIPCQKKMKKKWYKMMHLKKLKL